ncbi:MAG: helix-turn-helix domain-containing protein [Dethiobacteria bacterium]
MPDELMRIGEKIISMPKIEESVRKILQLRSTGLSQQEVANLLGLDRTFISRLESIGEIRKGKKIAVFGFPIKNKDEIKKISAALGVDFIYVVNEEERWNLVQDKSALDFFNEAMELIAKLQAYDLVVLISSRRWLKIAEAFFSNEIVFIELGPSPIKEDCLLNPDMFREIISKVTLGQEN